MILPGAHSSFVDIDVINEVDFAACVHRNLVAGPNAESGVVPGSKVHQTLSGG